MAERDQLVALAVQLAKAASERRGRRGRRRDRDRDRDRDRHRYQRGRRRRRGGGFVKLLKVAALMAAAAIVIPVAMITFGWLLGPRGYEGLIATPLSVLAAWAAILFFAFRSRTTPRTLAKVDIAQLPERTGVWLERQRYKLPEASQATLESIALRLDGLAMQVEGLDPGLPQAVEVRRLIGEELPTLVSGYQRLPEALKRQPLHDGPSPEQRLIEGLATVDEQIGRLQQRLAETDLHGLATHQRYLELKYKDDDKLE